MILYLIYLAAICALIRKNNLFGVLRANGIGNTQMALVFFGKALAVPVFYFVYNKLYGGIVQLDAGKFFHDAVTISDYAFESPATYLRVLIGLQHDEEGSADFANLLQYTYNWDNGQMKDFFYNDNRIVIRVHSLLNFICFGSYFAHALFNCLIGFAGIVFLSKALQDFFPKKNMAVLLVLCFFPTLWFYTGAVLKESVCLFLIGLQTLTVKKITDRGFSIKHGLAVCVLILVSFFIKPYLVISATVCFALFFVFEKYCPLRWQSICFVGTLLGTLLLANWASLAVKHQSLGQAIERHQRVFADMSKGGIFLKDKVKFVRLKHDTALVKKVPGYDSLYTIKARTTYTYWEDSHQQDTLFCAANSDTVTQYKLTYLITESKSNIGMDMRRFSTSEILLRALYFSLFHPLFLNARGALQWLASAENVLIMAAFVLITLGFIRRKKNTLLPLVLLSIALFVCVLAGLATPNSGAIFRYRSPVVVYILLAALYYFDIPTVTKKRESDTSVSENT